MKKKTYIKTLFYFIYIIYYKNINRYLIVNIDLISLLFILGKKDNTYEIKRIKQNKKSKH